MTVFASTNGTYNLESYLIRSRHRRYCKQPADRHGYHRGRPDIHRQYRSYRHIYPRLASIERYNPASQNTTSQTLTLQATSARMSQGWMHLTLFVSPDSTWGGNTSASTGQFTHTRSPNLTIPDLATVSDTITVSRFWNCRLRLS